MATVQPDFEKRIQDAIGAFNAHDVEAYLSFSTEDVIVENLATGEIINGKGEARASLKRAFAAIPDIKVEIKSFFSSGNRQCVEYVVNGTPRGELLGGIPATGKSFSVRGVGVSELREGKTFRVTQYGDSSTVLQQLGMLPALPQQ